MDATDEWFAGREEGRKAEQKRVVYLLRNCIEWCPKGEDYLETCAQEGNYYSCPIIEELINQVEKGGIGTSHSVSSGSDKEKLIKGEGNGKK